MISVVTSLVIILLTSSFEINNNTEHQELIQINISALIKKV